ncbi:MAG TPA: solute:sodium symporter family transporter [Longimicrobiales bacterium]|nr:solute:sodium symporter family transporter [Longimicrobiales bacterium]
MALTTLDLVVFFLFTFVVIGIALWASRHEKDEEDYFLAGRKLTWWLIGFSLIASNISTEHFVGMAGRGYELGLAIASYEWMAAITLVIVAIFFLPKFLKAGIYTIPEFLEYRYSRAARTLMATYMMIIYVVVALASVLYSGSIAIQAIFGIDMVTAVWIVAILAGIYSIYGGLASVVWSDLFYSIALLLGGVVVTVLGFSAIGGWEPFAEASAGRLHTVLPWNHPEMPWVAVFIGGLWIPNLFYWGLNQFITQRTLGAKSLADGQKGIILAAFIKLLIPFIIVFPGIMAAQLYPAQIANADAAYPVLMRELLPTGMRGFMFAALLGAVVSTLDSVLNSAATIFTMDLYKPYLKPAATPKQLVKVGRIATFFLMIIGALWAPVVAGFEGVYTYIQMVQGFISPGIVTVFLFGLLWPRVPAGAAIGAMLLGIPVYGALLWTLPDVAFLHHMMITFFVLALFIVVWTKVAPLETPKVLPIRADAVLETSPRVKLYGSIVVILTLALYVIFW